MALNPPPAFVGKLQIKTGINDKVLFAENNGGSTTDISTTATAGWYWPEALGLHLSGLMNAATVHSNTYEVYIDVSTGKWHVDRSTGTAQFYLRHATTDTDSVWSGGAEDELGNSLSTGEMGYSHMGFSCDNSPALGIAFTGDKMSAHYWQSVYPPAKDSDIMIDAYTIQSFAMDGQTYASYNFGPAHQRDRSNPYGKNYTRRLDFSRESVAGKAWYIQEFWLPYAVNGSSFRYYNDKSDSTEYYEAVLVGESLGKSGFLERDQSFPRFTGVLEFRRVA